MTDAPETVHYINKDTAPPTDGLSKDADPGIVEWLQEFLVMAQRGEITDIAIAAVHRPIEGQESDHKTETAFKSGNNGSSMLLGTAISLLHNRYFTDLDEMNSYRP